MATISTYIKMMDQFSQPLKRVTDRVNKTIVVMGKLRRALERPAKLNIKTSNVQNQLAVIQKMIQGTKVNITFNAREAVHKAQLMKNVLQKQLNKIKAKIRVEFPASLTVMFTNLQRLVLKLIAAIRRLQGSSGNNTAIANNSVPKSNSILAGLNKMLQPVKGIFGGLSKMLQPVKGIFGGLSKMLQPVKGIFGGLSKMLQPVKGIFGGLSKMLQPVKDIFGGLSKMLQPVKGIFGGLSKMLQPVKVIFGGLSKMLQPVKGIFGGLSKMLQPVKGIFGGLSKMLQPVKGIFGGLSKMLQPVKGIFGGLSKMLQPVKGIFGGLSKMLQPVKGIFGGLSKMLQPVKGIFGGLSKMLQPVKGIFGGLNKMFQAAKSKLGGGLKNLLPGSSGMFLTQHIVKPLVNTSIGGAMKQQQTEDMFIAKTGNVEIGKGMFEKFKSEALATGQDVNQSLQNSLSFLPEVQNVDQISQLNELSQRMAAFDISGNGIEGAASALKEALNGDTSSLANSLKMSPADMSSFKIEDLAQSGNVDGLISAFDQMLEKQNMGKEAFDVMMASPIKQVETLNNNLKSALADSGQQAVTAFMPLITMLNTAFQEGKFQPFFDMISGGLAIVAGVAAWAGQLILDNIDTVINILISLGIIALVVGANMFIAWVMGALPILLLIGAIVGLISILNYFGISTEDIIGFVGGLFMALVASIWNHIALLWNVIVSFAEFLINVFIDPIYAIKKLFYDLVVDFGDYMYNMIRSTEDFAGSFMSTILSAINGVLGGFNKLSAGIQKLTGIDLGQISLFDETNLNVVSDGFKKIMDKMKEPIKSKGVVDFSNAKIDQLNMSDQFDKGFNTVSTVFSGMTDTFGKNTDLSSWGNKASIGSTGNMENIEKVGEVGEVGKINDTVDISSEDLKMMRELAEMKNIQNYVSLTPSVNFGDTHVRNESDINTIVAQITQKLDQDIASSVNAVYR